MKTTIQISDDLRKKLKVFASCRDVSYDDVLDDMADVFKASIPFQTEDDFARWLEQNLEKFGFTRFSKEPGCYRITDAEGEKKVALEIIGTDYEKRHNKQPVDMIIAVFSSKPVVCGIPVKTAIRPFDDPREVMHRMSSKHEIVTIPKQLAENLGAKISGTGFSTLSEYVTYILRQVVTKLEKKTEKTVISKEDEDEVRRRLEALGYLR